MTPTRHASAQAPFIKRLLFSIIRAIIAVLTLFCANLLGFCATILFTPAWSYQFPLYYHAVMIAVNFGGALLPGYFAPTRKSALRMGLILSIVWGVISGLVLWYMGIILFWMVFSGVFVGRRFLREAPKEPDDEAKLAASKQKGGFFKVIASHKDEKHGTVPRTTSIRRPAAPQNSDLISDADLEEEK